MLHLYAPHEDNFSAWCHHDYFELRDVHSQCVYLQEELTVLFVCHRAVSMAAVYELPEDKI